MQELATSVRQDFGRKSDGQTGIKPAGNMMPPPTPIPKKRKSLPNLPDHEDLETPPKKRRDETIPNGRSPASRRIENHHKRSKTLGSLLSSSARRHSKSLLSFRSDFSPLGDGSLLSHSILQKARHLVPSVKTDTTRTDYFELKSRGIDPDSPAVPRTNLKRQRDEPQPNGVKVRKISPPDSTPKDAAENGSTNTVVPAPIDPDSDEALFAQMRAVREAMAESISWYQAERQKSELSSNKSSSVESTPVPQEVGRKDVGQKKMQSQKVEHKETEKERRLREFQTTPSRTEQRIRATGANGLLPNGWNGFVEARNGGRDDRFREAKQPVQAPMHPRALAFAAIERSGSNSSDNDDDEIEDEDEEEDDNYEDEEEEVRYEYEDEDNDDDDEMDYEHQGVAQSTYKGTGASADDAIEL